MEIRFEKTGDITKYFVNGTEYSKLEDVPAEFRIHFKDSNNNGIPDSMEFDHAIGSFFKSVKKDLIPGGVDAFDLDSLKSMSPYDGLDAPEPRSSRVITMLKIMAAIAIITFLVIAYFSFFGRT